MSQSKSFIIKVALVYLTLNLAVSEGNVTTDRECAKGSAGNCLDVKKESHTNPAYDGKNLYQSEQVIYRFDKLNDRDREYFNSKSPEFWQAADQETTLRQVILIHRHGDRTPINFAPNDSLAAETFWTFHGLGQLTNRGKARLYMLGEIIRMRYDKFLGSSVNKGQRKTRSSGALRCIESAQVFLSSFLSLRERTSPDASGLNWDQHGNKLAHLWQPASINTLSAKIDGMLNEGAECVALDKEYELLDQSQENAKINQDFKPEADLIKEIINFDMDHFYKWFWAGSFLEVELSYFDGKVDPRLEQAFPRIDQASNRALILYQSTLNSKRLRAGLLINDMIENMLNYRQTAQKGSPSGPFNKKFVHYSAHDLNLIVLLGMLNNIEKYPTRPDYAANIIFELHQDADEWFVKIFYMAHVPNEPVELIVDDCSLGHPKYRCTLNKFDSIMKLYKINSWQTWMHECANDISKIDPYAQNT